MSTFEILARGKDEDFEEYIHVGAIPLTEAIRKAQQNFSLYAFIVLKDQDGYRLDIHRPIHELSDNPLQPSCVTKDTWNKAGANGLSITWEDANGKMVKEFEGKCLVAADESSFHFSSAFRIDLTQDQDIAEDYIRYVLDHPYPHISYSER